MQRKKPLQRYSGLKRTRLKRRTPLRRSGKPLKRSGLRSKTSKRGTRKTSEQLRIWRSQPRRCLVCGRFPCDPHHRIPQSRPKDLPPGLDMDADGNLSPLCRECHTEYGGLMGNPGRLAWKLHYHLANARAWLALHPGASEALPGWLVLALEEEESDEDAT